MERKRKRFGKMLAFSMVLSLAISGTVYAAGTTTTEKAESTATEEAATETTKPKKKSKTVKITISAAGDCTLGIDPRLNYNFNNYYNRKGPSYFLKKVNKVFSKDDITVVNFEGTLTNSAYRTPKTFNFKGPAKHVKILKKGSVEVVNLANNHTMDWGMQGYNDTVNTLKKNKIGYCINDNIAYKTVDGVKVAFIGFNQLNGVSEARVKKAIKTAKKKKAKIIITSFHWGVERSYYPEDRQKAMAHAAIDAGASLVLGHHPHVLQGLEKYKGRYIVYSLGNFCFGGHTNPADKDTMIYQQTFYVKNGKLQKKNDVKVIPCSLSSSGYTNDFQPRILTGNSKKNLINKMNRLSSGMHVKLKSDGRPK